MTLWLYVAPYGGSGRIPDGAGLLVVCLFLNALLYGINDLADRETDLGNHRKGNWIFGPRGWSQDRIKRLLVLSFVLTVGALLWWGCQPQQPQPMLVPYLVWFVVGVGFNVVYNFCAIPPPWELFLVYGGFGMVTILSYWRRKGLDPEYAANNPSLLGYSSSSSPTFSINSLLQWGTTTTTTDTWLAGCNSSYWIHLFFLVVRSQLWTEYMDYESDRRLDKTKRTTLSRLPTKQSARNLVSWVLLAEVVWTFARFRQDGPLWSTLFGFSLFGWVVFVLMEYNHNWTSTTESKKKETTTTTTNVDIMGLALAQNVAGLCLLYDCWRKGVFVQ